jgi:hypothetical protein
MSEAEANLQILRPSRTKRRPGDIFVFQMPDKVFRFGRLISTSAQVGGFPANLVYLYDLEQDTKLPIPKLSPSRLLVPPLGTNQKPWTLGYFETVESSALAEPDVLPVHCFQDSRGWYFDENGVRLDHRHEPCGEYALQSYRTIDDILSDVLGFPQMWRRAA